MRNIIAAKHLHDGIIIIIIITAVHNEAANMAADTLEDGDQMLRIYNTMIEKGNFSIRSLLVHLYTF